MLFSLRSSGGQVIYLNQFASLLGSAGLADSSFQLSIWAAIRGHIKLDLLLMYAQHEDELHLVRLGSHSELFG